MSKVDYSKWDRIELSDDEDIECHPNIDKASWVRLMQRKIHQEREERRQRIASMKAEHNTNIQLRERLVILENVLKGEGQEAAAAARQRVTQLMADVVVYERDRKRVLLDPESDQFMKVNGVDEVFTMLMARLLDEYKVPRDQGVEAVLAALPKIIEQEYPKLDRRQRELLDNVAKEENESSKKLTSENIGKEGFNKTMINKKPSPAEAAASKSAGTKKSVEVLNPGYDKVKSSNVNSSSQVSHPLDSVDLQKPTATTDEFGLREMALGEEKLLLEFAGKETFEDSFRLIQQHPEIVSRDFSDHLMARAFQLQMKNKSAEARKCVKWSLALNYSMQLGQNGVGMFYKRMTTAQPEALAFFNEDLERTYAHLKQRSKVLAEKRKTEWSEDNSNLTPEQAQAFNGFPKHFQQALLSNDMEKINASFAKMGEADAKKVMDECQRVGLISVLSEEDAKKLMDNDEEAKKGAAKAQTVEPRPKSPTTSATTKKE